MMMRYQFGCEQYGWSISGLCIGSVPWTASTRLSRRLATKGAGERGQSCESGIAVRTQRVLTVFYTAVVMSHSDES